MRIALENRAVHERPGIAFIRVADDVFRFTRRFAAKFPFDASRETAAAAAAQAGFLDLADDLLGRPRAQDAAQRPVTLAGDVFLDLLGINQPAVAERDAHLLAGERQVAELGQVLDRLGLVGRRLAFGHAADDPFTHRPLFDDVLFDEARDHVGLDVPIQHMRPAVELDVDQRFLGAHPDAADADDLGRQFPASDFLAEGLQRLARAGSNAARAGADIDDRPGPCAGCQRLLERLAQRRQVLDGIESGHGGLDWDQLSAFTRCTSASALSRAQTLSLTSATGEMPQEPRQYTTSSVNL
jgi:hypothetical protein